MNTLIIGGFLAGMLYIGIRGFRKTHNISGFFVSNRNGNTLTITGSLLATTIGGSATLGIAGLGYSRGLTGAWWMLSGAACLLVLSWWLASRIRDYSVYTLPEVLEKQYGGRTIKLISSLLISIAWLGVISGQIIAAGHILSALWPGHLTSLILISGGVFILYTTLGGQYSILRTDLFQAMIIIAGIIVCIAIGIPAAGGFDSITGSLPESHLSFPLSKDFGGYNLLMYFLFIGMAFLVGPDIYSRLFCARSPETARRSTLITALTMIPLAFLITGIGLLARVLLPGIAAENAFPSLIMSIVPNGLNGLVIAALLAAVMSSADTCLLTTSTIITADIINPLSGSHIPEKKLLFMSRIGIVIIGIISVGISLLMKNIISSLFLAYTVYSAGIVLPILFGFYSKKLNLTSTGAVAAVIAGGGLGLILKIMKMDSLLVYCFPVSAVALFAVSYYTNKRGNRRERRKTTA